jgi:hypothetical protein
VLRQPGGNPVPHDVGLRMTMHQKQAWPAPTHPGMNAYAILHGEVFSGKMLKHTDVTFFALSTRFDEARNSFSSVAFFKYRKACSLDAFRIWEIMPLVYIIYL